MREGHQSHTPEKRVLRELPNIENRSYIPSTTIWAADGWLDPRGIFWGCGDDHEDCARYLATRINPREYDYDDSLPARTKIQAAGYIQITNGMVLTGPISITSKQAEKLNQAELKIPIYVRDSEFTKYFSPVINATEQGQIPNHISILLKQFVENGFYSHVINDTDSLRELFDFLTKQGFEYLGEKRTGSYATDEQFFALLPESEYVLELWDHHHVDRNLQGLFSESRLKITPLDVAIEVLGFDPYNPYHDDNSTEFKFPNVSDNDSHFPNITAPRIKGIPKRERMEKFLD